MENSNTFLREIQHLSVECRQSAITFVKLTFNSRGIYLVGNGFRQKVSGRAEQLQ
jgi:hypothetical protein